MSTGILSKRWTTERFPIWKSQARESAWEDDFLFLTFSWRLFMMTILLTYTPNYMSEHCGGRKRYSLYIVLKISKHLLVLQFKAGQQRRIYFSVYLHIDVTILLSVLHWWRWVGWLLKIIQGNITLFCLKHILIFAVHCILNHKVSLNLWPNSSLFSASQVFLTWKISF